MPITEASLQTAIQARGYGTDSATAQAEAIKSTWRRVLGMRRWPFLEATSTALTTTPAISTLATTAVTDLARIDATRLAIGTESYELKFTPPQQIRTMLQESSSTETGVPEFWSYYAGLLRFYPRPDRAYTVSLDYKKRPTYNTSDILFPEEYQDVLVWGAVAELSFRQRELNGYAEAQFKDRLNDMIDDYGIEQRQSTLEVGHSSVWSEVST